MYDNISDANRKFKSGAKVPVIFGTFSITKTSLKVRNAMKRKQKRRIDKDERTMLEKIFLAIADIIRIIVTKFTNLFRK